MKILVYGAGVLGSLYAARLTEAGHDVSVLARGRRLTAIREQGIILEEAFRGDRSVTRMNAIERLGPDDAYDLIVVLVRKNQLGPVLPVLAANRRTPSILFMQNNAAGTDDLVAAVGRERVLLGFAGAGGSLDGDIVRYSIAPRLIQPTTLGEVDGCFTQRLQRISEAFAAAGFPVATSQNMDAWLKTHAAWISPLENAIASAGGDSYRLARTRERVQLMVRAIREGFRVLRALDIPIVPRQIELFFDRVPEPILVTLMQLWFRSKKADVFMAGHTRAAPDEAKQIVEEFRALSQRTSVPTPAIQELARYVLDEVAAA